MEDAGANLAGRGRRMRGGACAVAGTARRPARKAGPPRWLGEGLRGGAQVLQNLEATGEAAVYSEAGRSSNVSKEDCCC